VRKLTVHQGVMKLYNFVCSRFFPENIIMWMVPDFGKVAESEHPGVFKVFLGCSNSARLPISGTPPEIIWKGSRDS